MMVGLSTDDLCNKKSRVGRARKQTEKDMIRPQDIVCVQIGCPTDTRYEGVKLYPIILETVASVFLCF